MSKIVTYSKSSIDRAVRIIKDGGVVVFPTETVYALACDATNSGAVQKLYQIKQRDGDKPLSVLVESVDVINNYVALGERLRKFINHFSPGPVTYVLDVKKDTNLSKYIGKDNTVGFRIPDHAIAQEILAKCGVPLVGTSVNLSGEPAAISIEDIPEEIIEQVDLILDSGKASQGISSTVVRVFYNMETKIFREGAISKESILKKL